jgi:8-oxo-dGTP diphosphatase
MQREFPERPLVGVGAVVIDRDRVLLVRRGREPLKGHWSLPGGLLEVGESLTAGVIREMLEETGMRVEPLELVELVDRVVWDGDRVRYHYVIADYLCRVIGGALSAGSDADDVQWVELSSWIASDAQANSLNLDDVTVRVIEAGWQRAQQIARNAEDR